MVLAEADMSEDEASASMSLGAVDDRDGDRGDGGGPAVLWAAPVPTAEFMGKTGEDGRGDSGEVDLTEASALEVNLRCNGTWCRSLHACMRALSCVLARSWTLPRIFACLSWARTLIAPATRSAGMSSRSRSRSQIARALPTLTWVTLSYSACALSMAAS